MRVLLDTHAWLWMLAAPERLTKKSRTLVIATENELLLSAASAWEIAIKYRLGKLHLPEAPEDYIPRLMATTGITPLPVDHRHALHVANLPAHHRARSTGCSSRRRSWKASQFSPPIASSDGMTSSSFPHEDRPSCGVPACAASTACVHDTTRNRQRGMPVLQRGICVLNGRSAT